MCHIPRTSCTTISRYKAYLKQYVEVARGEPARRRLIAAANPFVSVGAITAELFMNYAG